MMQGKIRRRFILLLALFLLVPGIASCRWEQKRELSRNREKWQAQNIMDYRYKVFIISSWGANEIMPLTLVYRNGELVSVTENDGEVQELYWDTIGGIDAIFQEAEDSLSTRRRKVTEIEYDPVYGFPSYVNIFYDESGVGGEDTRRYTIRGFEVLTEP